MSSPHPPKVPPRFVPTLTEVVPDPVLPQSLGEATAVPQQSGAVGEESEQASVLQEQTLSASSGVLPFSEGLEDLVVRRVLQRVDVGLEQRLRDAITTVVQEQTRSVLPRLREEIESIVRQVVYEAVADELASVNAGHSLKT
ncbi:MAG: hypothetical protein PHU77_07360 [Simplicispira sp.]|nr:hypothetical protein [Simplicispira sp.]